MESKGSDREFHTPSPSSDYSNSPVEFDSRKPVSTRVFYIGLFILSIAILIFSLFFFLELKDQARASVERSNNGLKHFLVDQCEEKNRNRQATQAQFEYLVYLLTRGNETVDPRAVLFLDFIHEANDPVNCDINSIDFGIDTTPPKREELPDAGVSK